MHRIAIPLIVVLASAFLAAVANGQEDTSKKKPEAPKAAKSNPVVAMKTSLGTITIELFEDKAPITVQNFLTYVDEKFFDSTVFHRVIKGFMIQGGGFRATDPIRQKKTHAPIKNESTNGLKNARGTIAMARTQDPNSATSQFFINVVDNNSLNRGAADPSGYAVFGKVVAGMEVVDKIREVKTGLMPAIALSDDKEIPTRFNDVPLTKVVIESVRRVPPKK